MGFVYLINLNNNYQQYFGNNKQNRQQLIKTNRQSEDQVLMSKLVLMFFHSSAPEYQNMVRNLRMHYSSSIWIQFIEISSKEDIRSIEYSKSSRYILVIPSNHSQKITRYISMVNNQVECVYVVLYTLHEIPSLDNQEQTQGCSFVHNIRISNLEDLIYLINRLSLQSFTNKEYQTSHQHYLRMTSSPSYQPSVQSKQDYPSNRIITKSFKNLSPLPQLRTTPVFIIIDSEDDCYRDFYTKIPAHYILLSNLPAVCPAKQKNTPVIILCHISECFDLLSRIEHSILTSILLYSYPIKPNPRYICSPMIKLISNKSMDVMEYLKQNGIKMKYEISVYKSLQLQSRDVRESIEGNVFHFVPYGTDVKEWIVSIKDSKFQTVSQQTQEESFSHNTEKEAREAQEITQIRRRVRAKHLFRNTGTNQEEYEDLYLN